MEGGAQLCPMHTGSGGDTLQGWAPSPRCAHVRTWESWGLEPAEALTARLSPLAQLDTIHPFEAGTAALPSSWLSGATRTRPCRV